MSRSKPAPRLKPVLNPVQRADLRRLLPLIPNERRLPVIAAYLGISVVQLWQTAGMSRRLLCHHRQGTPTAVKWCWRLAQRLDMPFHELWELDDGFDPVRALGMKHQAPKTTLVAVA